MKSFTLCVLGLMVLAGQSYADTIPPYDYTCTVTQETLNTSGQPVHTVIQTEKANLVANPIDSQSQIETYTAKLRFTVPSRAGSEFSVDASASLIPDASYPVPGNPDIQVPGSVYNAIRTSIQGTTFDVPVASRSLSDFKSHGESLGNGPWFKFGDTAFYLTCTLARISSQ